MAKEQASGINLKLLMDKEKKRVIYAESDSDFVDVLFSFLTIPMGTVASLSSFHKPLQGRNKGCFNHLYKSVQNIDIRDFRFKNNVCKSMLLSPRSSAELHCGDLKLKLKDSDPTRFFYCPDPKCKNSWASSHYADLPCVCGRHMNVVKYETKKSECDEIGGVFVKGSYRFIITDDLRVSLVSTNAMFSMFSKLGITTKTIVEEKNLVVGVSQVKSLLISSLVSKTVLTDTFLTNGKCYEPTNKVSFLKLNSAGTEAEGKEEVKAIGVKLIISKSRNRVCYAEVNKDFVNLLFSFLTIPVGHVAKQIHHDSSLSGCVHNLYESVAGLDNNYFKCKQMLVSPSLAVSFCYRNDLLGIQEPSCSKSTELQIFYSRYRSYSPISAIYNDGFLTCPTTFIVTDCLKVTPISSIVCLSILQDLNVGPDDIVEQVVHVGKIKALQLLVSSLVLEDALTNTFLLKKPKQEP